VEIIEKNLWWKKDGATVALLSADTLSAIQSLTPEQVPTLAFAENFAYEMSRVPLLEALKPEHYGTVTREVFGPLQVVAH
jgi:hypothetical protein